MFGFAPLIIQGIGAGISFLSKKKSARDAKKLGLLNAAYTRAEGAEKLRRAKLEQSKMLGTANARSAASGVAKKSRSVTTYLDEMQKNFNLQNDWLQRSTASKAEIGLYGANAQSSSAMFGAFSGLASDAASIMKAWPE